MDALLGVGNVARVITSSHVWFARFGLTVEPREMNSQPGALIRGRDGGVFNAIVLDVLDGHVQTVRSVLNPDKLAHVGPVGDAWALKRELRRTHRSRE